jgi:hypothetical protein
MSNLIKMKVYDDGRLDRAPWTIIFLMKNYDARRLDNDHSCPLRGVQDFLQEYKIQIGSIGQEKSHANIYDSYKHHTLRLIRWG